MSYLKTSYLKTSYLELCVLSLKASPLLVWMVYCFSFFTVSVHSETTIHHEPLTPTNTDVDSLERVLSRLPTLDTNRVGTLCELAAEYNSIAPAKAHSYALQALTLAQELHFEKGEARSLLAISTYFWQQNLYGKSLEYLVQAAARFERLGAKADLARVYTHIGNIHLRTERYQKALEFYHTSLIIAREINDVERIATNISMQAQVYRMHLKDYDRAIWHLQEGIRLFASIGNIRRVGSNTNIIGTVYDNKGDHATALQYHLKALDIERRIPDKAYITETLTDVATSLNALHRHAESLPYLAEAIEQADKGNARHIKIYLYSTLAEAYSALGRFHDAYRARSIAADVKDTIFSKDLANAVAEAAARYDIEQKNKELRLGQVKIEYERFLRNVLIAGSLVCIGIAAWFGVLFRTKQRVERALREKQYIIEEQSSSIQHANTALQQQNLTLQQLNTEKNEFLGIAIHDLKNPLSAIYLTSELVQQSLQQNKLEKVEEYMDGVRASANQMLAIIGNMLDINRLEQGGWKFMLEALDYEVLIVLVESYQLRAEAKAIILTLEIQAQQNVSILADYTAFQHVIDNLLSNAVKYTPYGGSVTVRVTRENNYIRIAVQNSGQGLTEDDKRHLFGKFARLSARPTGGESSTGLGLSIVKKLVEAMNGRVWCESELGKGATFIVELPM
jgi:signal transduction histidine kinase